MKKRTLLCLALLLPCLIQATEDLMRFRVYLKDKQIPQTSDYVPSLPSFNLRSGSESTAPVLSQASMERRRRQDIALDSTDYAIFPPYLKSIRDLGYPIVTQSRWMNTVVISAEDSSCIKTLSELPFVNSVQLVWRNPSKQAGFTAVSAVKKSGLKADSSLFYGKADAQINMLNLSALHHSGYRGTGKMIAVIDAGFYGVDTISWFKDLSLVAARDFIYPPSNIYQGYTHGTSVLSVLAANNEYDFVGSAPEASYCLLRSEDVLSEFPIEEDYWAAAAEFADSLGADIITTSLGYSEFDQPELSYQKEQLDGKTSFISHAASIAATKGILLVFSAGNDGNKPWQKISFPSDVENVLTVGAVQPNLERCYFSSVGPTADGRVKPDVMAMGSGIYILNGVGNLILGSGTSFSAPLVAGMAACIWNAFPQLTSGELRRYIKQSGDRAANPDTLYGYGIPDAQKVMLALGMPSVKGEKDRYYCYPNPAKDRLYFSGSPNQEGPVNVAIYNTLGQKMLEKEIDGAFSFLDISRLPRAVYLVDMLVPGFSKRCQKILISK